MTVFADAYQAAIAVTIPRYPPSVVRPAPAAPAKAPNASTKNVMVKRTNTTKTGRLKVSAAIVMYAVKMPHASRKIPTAGGRASAGIFATLNVTSSANAIQKAPYDVNAVAPKVLFRLNSHMPAQNCANPPYPKARPNTTGSAALGIKPAFTLDRTKVVNANPARPSGAGSATD